MMSELIDCWLFNVQRPIFLASSGREYVQQYIIKRETASKKKRKEINMETLAGWENKAAFDCHWKIEIWVGCGEFSLL